MIKKLLLFLFIGFCAIMNTSAQTYQELITRSVEYLEQEDYAASEQTLKAALKKEPANPDNFMLFANLGSIQSILDKNDEALTSYSIALSKYPNNISILHKRAALYCNTDSLDAAMNDYNSILLINKNDTEALYQRGLIYMNKGSFTKAEADLEQIQTLKPKDLASNMALILVMKRRGEWEEAENKYTDLIYENRSNADLLLNRAECYLQLNKLARAQEDLNKASSFGSNNPLLYILRGQLKLRQYDKFSARADFEKAGELGANPKLVEELLKHCK